ncbi:hypothetical protein D7V91_14100 [bacterium 1xD42-67]|nr:hypothetical protein D7V91_14100 [bacterium 1xD42-67]
MAALQCEICGGKLIGKPGGIFECDSCGVEYSSEWAKAKVQEIKGTVKIEGPVQISGIVKLEDGTSIESLIKRGNIALEDCEWNVAKEIFQQILSIDSNNAEGYLGLAMAENSLCNWDALEQKWMTSKQFHQNRRILRFRQFAKSDLAVRFEKIDQAYKLIHNQKIIRMTTQRAHISPAANLLVCSQFHTVGLNLDGTVVAVGRNDQGQCDVQSWGNIIAIGVGYSHTIGLKLDGSVVAAGAKDYDCCKVQNWQDIVAIAVSDSHTVGLKSDGTVVATGWNAFGQCNVGKWSNIISIAIGREHTVGLKADGTVVATGNNDDGRCNVQNWKNISTITAFEHNSVGIQTDGAAIIIGANGPKRLLDIVEVGGGFYGGGFIALSIDGTFDNSPSFEGEIVTMAIGFGCSAFLHSDGTVVANGNEDYTWNTRGWHDIVAVAAGYDHIVGIQSDGVVVATGRNYEGQCNTQGWKLFNSINTLEQEQAKIKARKKAECQAKIAALNAEKASIRAELPTIKGLFSGGKRRELEARLTQIEKELRKL